jgi:superfamily II DNA or RNA helicase
MLDTYSRFIHTKLSTQPPTGLSAVPALHASLFPFQRDAVMWSLRRGRACLFEDTGLGKTRQQIAWADGLTTARASDRTIILAPLAVAAQTADEGASMGVNVTVCRDDSDVRDGINVTNYDRIHRFDPGRFGAVVLDESSIIKHHDAKTLRALLDAFSETPFRLACTATPAPNDHTELGTHAEFMGICSRAEMLSEFFCHDGGDTSKWRLKGHARVAFWRWVASWGALIRRPSDLGYDDADYDLPPLHVHEHIVAAPVDTYRSQGLLFAVDARTLSDRRNARKASTNDRVSACAARVIEDGTEAWVVWCDLNAESEALARAIPGAVEIRGSHTADEKEERLRSFSEGRTRVLVTKPSIAGFGLNWQHCARQAFVGVTDSWEAYYQAVRRSWRFGQKREVHAHVYASEAEGAVLANLKRKEADARTMAEELSRETSDAVRAEVRGIVRETNEYAPRAKMVVPGWMKTEEEEKAA